MRTALRLGREDHGRPLQWGEVSPLLVVEVLGCEDDQKDLVRNVVSTAASPAFSNTGCSTSERIPAEPMLRVYRRQGDDWNLADYDSRSTYTTDLLPGFALPVRPE